MLIYVDKKKEKRRKIKIFCIISFIITFIVLNIFSYNNYLNHGDDKLTDYKKIIYQNDWYNKTTPIQLFINKTNNTPNIILLPKTFNREIALTLANTFTNLPQQNYILTFTEDIKEKDFVRQLAEQTLPKIIANPATTEIILTSDFSKIAELLSGSRFNLKSFNYTKALQLTNKNLNILLDKQYPLLTQPQSKIEKEQQALTNFSNENKKELTDFILHNKQPKFSKQSTFLKNIRLCLQSENTITCQMHPKTSLTLNIQNALKTFSPKHKPQKLLLLSSNQRIKTKDLANLKNNEGLYFRFKQLKSYLLPQERLDLIKPKESLYMIKEKAGINPKYTSPQMKLYKFNITEVTLDEEI